MVRLVAAKIAMGVSRTTSLLVGLLCIVLCKDAVAAPTGNDYLLNMFAALSHRSLQAEDLTIKAECVLQENTDLPDDIKSRNDIAGTITFEQLLTGGSLEISVRVTGIDQGSASLHGFHVHASSNMSNGCTSTGGHFNPLGKRHGAPTDEDRHVGDLGNVLRLPDGSVSKDFADNVASLVGPNSIIGKSIVLHKDTDDLGKGDFPDSLTTGHAGARLACCEIVQI